MDWIASEPIVIWKQERLSLQFLVKCCSQALLCNVLKQPCCAWVLWWCQEYVSSTTCKQSPSLSIVYGNTPRPSFGCISLCRTNLMCNYVSVSSRDRHPKEGHTAKENPTTSGIRNETKPLRVSQTGLWIWSNKCYIVKGWVRSSGTHLISVFQPLEWWLLRKICKFVTTFYLWKFSVRVPFLPSLYCICGTTN